jgi:hypothetical protein
LGAFKQPALVRSIEKVPNINAGIIYRLISEVTFGDQDTGLGDILRKEWADLRGVCRIGG